MIPADVASRLRLITPDQPAPPQATTPIRQLADVLSELVPGQRLMAEIQALLPNGAYRAIIAQRDVTLALPFSAKPGDSLELEVVESDGKLTLAFVGKRGGQTSEEPAAQSVATRFSQTGRLIGDLLAGVDADGKKAPPAPLNSNQPLVDKMPSKALELVPILREAVGKSGMFYEAQQARWVEGKLSATVLLQQPQGRLSPALQNPEMHARLLQDNVAAPLSLSRPDTSLPASPPMTSSSTLDHSAATSTNSTGLLAGSQIERTTTTLPDRPITANVPAENVVHRDLTPLVQQQLDALASQNFSWQGQVWPGQNMRWEIQEDDPRRPRGEDDAPERWQTRLQLDLPNLGGIEARIRLANAQSVDIELVARSESGHISLSAAASELRNQLEAAGLVLSHWTLRRDETTL